MKRYQDADIEKARKLRRKEGYSFAQLERLTGIPATTIRNWCTDDFVSTRWDTLLRSNKRTREELKLSEISILENIMSIDVNNAKILTAIIYGCEGSKYPATNKLEMTNSDPELLKVFIKLLRKTFTLDETKFRIHLQIHDIQNYKKLKSFWSKLLEIPKERFIKPTITKARGGKHRKVYYGTCSLRYSDYRIQLKLIGIYEAFLKKFGEVA